MKYCRRAGAGKPAVSAMDHLFRLLNSSKHDPIARIRRNPVHISYTAQGPFLAAIAGSSRLILPPPALSQFRKLFASSFHSG